MVSLRVFRQVAGGNGRLPAMTDSLASDEELLAALRNWRDRAPSPDVRGLPTVSVPALARLRRLLPEGGAQRLLAVAYTTALRASSPRRLLAAAGLKQLEDLRRQPLAAAQARARRLARRDLALAAGSGTAFGLAGAAGLAADVPALVLLALRSLIRVGYSYGEAPSPALAAGIFALASADTVEEKRLAWRAAVLAPSGAAVAMALDDAALRDGLERAAEREFAKQALASSLQKLGLAMVQRLGWRKAAGALPLIGAALGGAVNARFIHQVVEAAIQVHNARRLAEAGYEVLSAGLGEGPAVAASQKQASRSRARKRKLAD